MTYREKRVESNILPDLPVLSFDTAAAWRYGELRAELEREGKPIGDAGVRIAAIAQAHGRHRQRAILPADSSEVRGAELATCTEMLVS